MIYILFKWLNKLTFAWNEPKRRFKKSQRKWVYIYLLIKTPCQKWYKTDWLSEKKSWEERKACREKFKVETKRENILRVNKLVLWDIYDYRFTTYVYRQRCGETL